MIQQSELAVQLLFISGIHQVQDAKSGDPISGLSAGCTSLDSLVGHLHGV
jgi:hypothetical protein